MANKVLIFSAPSGSGKSTVVNHLLKFHPEFEFSVSATSRPPRGQEQDGVEYYFLDVEEFRRRIEADAFVEYEEVYPGRFYGTLKEEVERIWAKDHVILFDVDVKGGVNLKKYFGDKALSIFVEPPTVQELENRLRKRGTETEESLRKRVEKAEYELSFAPQFDKVILNDNLDDARAEMLHTIREFLDQE